MIATTPQNWLPRPPWRSAHMPQQDVINFHPVSQSYVFCKQDWKDTIFCLFFWQLHLLQTPYQFQVVGSCSASSSHRMSSSWIRKANELWSRDPMHTVLPFSRARPVNATGANHLRTHGSLASPSTLGCLPGGRNWISLSIALVTAPGTGVPNPYNQVIHLFHKSKMLKMDAFLLAASER